MIEQLLWVSGVLGVVGGFLGVVFRIIPLGWTLLFGLVALVSGLLLCGGVVR